MPGDGSMRLGSHWQSQSREVKLITNPKIERLQKSARKVRTQIYHREQEGELFDHARSRSTQNRRGTRKAQLDRVLVESKLGAAADSEKSRNVHEKWKNGKSRSNIGKP